MDGEGDALSYEGEESDESYEGDENDRNGFGLLVFLAFLACLLVGVFVFDECA